MEQESKYMVATRCMTYNQAAYIEDALRGFAMQKTDFPVVFIITDDASTDGEPEVLKNWIADNVVADECGSVWKEKSYGQLAVGILKGKPHSTFVFLLLAENHYTSEKRPLKLEYISEWENDAKYIAFCEGDDYWTVPTKLSQQVNFMNNHPSHSLCFCANYNMLPNGRKIADFRYKSDKEECAIKDAIRKGGGYMSTASMLIRRKMLNNRPLWSMNVPVGDLPLMLVLMARGKCGYINQSMVVYRVNSVGSWSDRMKAEKEKKMYLFTEIRKMYDAFDEWTSHKYHYAILKRRLVISLYIIRAKLNLI